MRLSRVLVPVVLVFVALSVHSSAQTGRGRQFVAGEILVKFRPGINAAARANAHRAEGGAPLIEIQRTGVQRVRVRPGDESASIARYARNPNVLYAEPNYIRSVPTPITHDSGSGLAAGDYRFDEQWALDNTGQQFYCIPWPFGGELCLYAGTPDADIDAPEAWAISTGSSDVTVAVIDTGIDYTHPDLAPNYAGGYDFVFSDSDPVDDHGHGSHVAGTIAAALGNVTGIPGQAEGVVGVAPNARILAYKVCRVDGTCDDFAIQQALARAITDGANVVNMSLGEAEYSQSLNDAVQDAWNAGLVIVAGAGNNGTTGLFYPAALDNVISVAAFDEDHRRPTFSNYGSWVDLSAPGNAIMSTYPMAACGPSTTPGDVGCYSWSSGTSMATPHVSGAAALVWSRSDVARNSHVVDVLVNSADGNGVAPQRLDTWTIHGGLNLHGAMSYQSTKPLADAGDDQILTDGDRDGAELASLDGSASSDPDSSIVSYTWREGNATIATGATAVVSLSVGKHTLTLEVTTSDGESASDSVVVTVYPSDPVTVSASSPRATEAGPTDGAFTVSRIGSTSVPLTVHYTVTGTAVAGIDYVSLPGTVTIEAGSSTAILAVTPLDDVGSESDESVVLTLNADEGYSVGSPSVAIVTIVSDDLPSDLIVASVAAPSTGGADADIVITETTRNQGSGSAPPSETGFYLSTNSSLDAADVYLGSRSVPTLGPGATHTASTTLRLPPSTATRSYYIVAKADAPNEFTETVETNNARASGVVRVGPDFIVSAVAAPASAVAGSTVSITDTTMNQGGGTAEASMTRFYLSTNSSFDGSDVMIGSRSVPSLPAGAQDSASTTVTVPAGTAAGSYYVIARADGAGSVVETTETNNNRTSSTVKIGPDLLVSAVSVPSSAAAGGTITATETTRNQGAGTAAASSTGFYLSTNNSWDATDVFIGSRAVGELGPSASSTGSTSLQIPAETAPGTYYVIAKADWDSVISETIETNNVRASGAVRIGGDLVLTSLVASSAVMAGGPITVTDTTANQGAAPVPGSATGFYLSLNGSYDSTDVFLGSRVVGSLGPSQNNSASTQLVVPAGTAAGTYRVIGVADANGTIAESLENNNTRTSGSVRVGPDLDVTALTVPSPAVAGSSVNASVTVKNQGAETAPASATNFYLSTNSSLDGSDVLIAVRPVPPLGPGLSDTGSVALPIPASTTPGTWYIVAKADGDNAVGETAENNNTYARSISIAAAP